MPGLRSADSYRTWADLRDLLFEIVSTLSSLYKVWLEIPEGFRSFFLYVCGFEFAFEFPQLSLILPKV